MTKPSAAVTWAGADLCRIRVLAPGSGVFTDATESDRRAALMAIAATLGASDIHPWEGWAAYGCRLMPPLAVAWSQCVDSTQRSVIRSTWLRACRAAEGALRERGHRATDIDIDRASCPDLPIERLDRLLGSRDQVLVTITRHLTDGADWAAQALLRIAEAG